MNEPPVTAAKWSDRELSTQHRCYVMFAWTMIVAVCLLATLALRSSLVSSQASEPGTGAASQGDYCCIRKDRSSSCLTLTMLSFERRSVGLSWGRKHCHARGIAD